MKICGRAEPFLALTCYSIDSIFMLERICSIIRLFVLVVLIGSAGSLQAQMKDGEGLVRATLISDFKSIQPGQKFRIGVLYKIEPSWHTYWKYSGDAGIPTKIAWQLPSGFKIGDLQWPMPMRDKEPGDLEVFDYEKEVLLFADVQAPNELPSGPLEFKAKSDWLVCSSSCIPGSAEVALPIDVGANLPSDSGPIFQNYASKLPQP